MYIHAKIFKEELQPETFAYL